MNELGRNTPLKLPPLSLSGCRRKILGRLSGEPTLQFHALKGLQALEDTVRELGAEHNFTRLVPDLSEGTDPDDAFSRVPYEKGFNFLYFLQSTVRLWISASAMVQG